MGQSIYQGSGTHRSTASQWGLASTGQRPRVRYRWRSRLGHLGKNATESVPVFDAATLSALSGDIGPGVFAEVLIEFADDLRFRLDRIASAAANANLKALAFESHAVSGCSRTFGAMRMARICRGIEQAVEAGDDQTAMALAGFLNAVGEETLGVLANYH